MQDVEQTIRERAYQLWIEAGCQDGRAETYWLAAQRELLSTSVDEIGRASMGEVYETTEKPKRAKTSRKGRRAV